MDFFSQKTTDFDSSFWSLLLKDVVRYLNFVSPVYFICKMAELSSYFTQWLQIFGLICVKY